MSWLAIFVDGSACQIVDYLLPDNFHQIIFIGFREAEKTDDGHRVIKIFDQVHTWRKTTLKLSLLSSNIGTSVIAGPHISTMGANRNICFICVKKTHAGME